MRRHLIPGVAAVAPGLIIFDKGGTLIDFHEMWRGWISELARRLEVSDGIAIAGRLFRATGFDPCTGQIAHDGPLATMPMAELRQLTAQVLGEAGLSRQASRVAVASTWYAPDPVVEARPLADLYQLFTDLRKEGLRIAVATVDDRGPTEATFCALGVDSLVDALVCGNDGISIKPAPDMVWSVCQATGLSPAQSVVVGDAVTDLQMGRAAGSSLVVAVLTGVALAGVLAPHADLVLESVEKLVATCSSES